VANHIICAEEGFVIALTAADLHNNFFTEVSWHNHISGDLIFRKRLEGWSATIIGLGGGYVSVLWWMSVGYGYKWLDIYQLTDGSTKLSAWIATG
jgi:hypothetical protein